MSVPRLLAYSDLEQCGIVNNRTQLSRNIKDLGFPEGFLISSNARRWTEDEVAEWVEVRRAISTGQMDAPQATSRQPISNRVISDNPGAAASNSISDAGFQKKPSRPGRRESGSRANG
jgi:predicted DNA-binding transcriptional regulator AlpA